MLEVYNNAIEADEPFDEGDLRQFESVYSANDEEKFLSDPAGFAELNYSVASLCFTYYEPDGGDSFASRINKAYTYLSKNHTAVYEDGTLTEYTSMNLSECYYQICSFYKKYILSKTADDASASDFQALFDTLNSLLDSIENDEKANNYDKLELYNGIFLLLYDRRTDMAGAQFAQAEVLAMFDRVYESASAMNIGENKVYAKALQEEMVSNYTSYRSAIERTYETEERK